MKNRKRIIRKVHNALLYTTTAMAALLFLVSICALDSQTWAWLIIGSISLAWLAFVAWANDCV